MKNENTETVETEVRKEKSNTKSHTKFKLALLYVCSFLASTLPLLFVIINKWDHYTQAPSDTIKITVGGIIGLFFLFLKAIGKLKMPSRIIFYAVIFVTHFLSPIRRSRHCLISFICYPLAFQVDRNKTTF